MAPNNAKTTAKNAGNRRDGNISFLSFLSFESVPISERATSLYPTAWRGARVLRGDSNSSHPGYDRSRPLDQRVDEHGAQERSLRAPARSARSRSRTAGSLTTWEQPPYSVFQPLSDYLLAGEDVELSERAIALRSRRPISPECATKDRFQIDLTAMTCMCGAGQVTQDVVLNTKPAEMAAARLPRDPRRLYHSMVGGLSRQP